MAYMLRTRWHAVLLKRREIRAHAFRKVRIDTAVKPQWVDPVTGQLTGTSSVDVVYSIKLPAGTTVYQGPVASQGGVYVGGSGLTQTQIFVPKTTLGLSRSALPHCLEIERDD